MIFLVDSKGPDQAAQIVHICLKTHFLMARLIYDHYHIDTLQSGKTLAPATNILLDMPLGSQELEIRSEMHVKIALNRLYYKASLLKWPKVIIL